MFMRVRMVRFELCCEARPRCARLPQGTINVSAGWFESDSFRQASLNNMRTAVTSSRRSEDIRRA